MKKRKKAKLSKIQKLRAKLAKIFRFSWVRFEEQMPSHHKEDEEVSHWVKMF